MSNAVEPIKRKEDVEAIGAWLKANVAPKYYLIYTLGLNTGLRMDEILSLRSKNGYLFPSNWGSHIDVDTFRKILKRAARECGVSANIGTHTLRKTFGWFHFMENHDIAFLQQFFGHASAEITAMYIGLLPV